ncbi:hypothetical protein [Streptomyces sp. NPDC020917]|uniref:hypothetical protein n=1 Tax=Streptomyces sp. NPDC020917 TaxID=3365102 RepID=UPI00379335ED
MTSHDLATEARQPWLPSRAGSALLLRGRLREALIVGVPALIVTVLGWRQRWVGDDGMVYGRTVREILAGNGPVFNSGERAEASTGALWQWLLAACSFVSGKEPSVVAATLGVLFTGVGYALAVAAARKAMRPLTAAPLLPVGMLVLLAIKADWDYASSGLENGLATGWIALAWWYLVVSRGPGTTATGTDAAPAATPAFAAPPFGAPAATEPPFGDPASTGPPFGARASFAPPFGDPASTAPPFAAPAAAEPPFGDPAAAEPPFGDPAFTYPSFGAPVLVTSGSGGAVRGEPGRGGPPDSLTGFGPTRRAPAGVRATGRGTTPRLVRGARTAAAAGAGRPRGYAAAVVIGLGPLVRPELGLVTVVFLAALLAVLRPRPLRAAGLLLAAAALPAAYEVFRAGYYGVLVPLPAVTNEAAGALWGRGLAYVTDFADPYRLWMPLAVLAVVAVQAPRRMLRPELLAPPVAGLLSCLYVCRVGGDSMHGRMLLPGLLLLMLPLCAAPLGRLTGAATAVVAIWAVLCALLWRPPASSGSPYPIIDEQAAYTASAGPHPVTEMSHARRVTPLLPAELAAENAGKPVLLLQTPADGGRFVSLPLAARFRTRLAGSYGLLGYNGIVTPLDATAVDPLGLAYPLAAHQARPPGSTAGRSGHEKPLDPAWIVADYTDPGTPLPQGLDPARVAAARHALSCGRLAELQRSVRAPMTPERFWENLRGSWSRTGFRFPADPVQAERVLCRG